MDRVAVTSSNIASVGYDRNAQLLEVAFHDGSVYQYYEVPEGAFAALIGAESVGKYFSGHIKGRYRYTRV